MFFTICPPLLSICICISTLKTYPCTHVCAKSLQSCFTLCDPMDCSPPGSSAHGILQGRILERVAPGDLPDPRIKPFSLMPPELAGEFFTSSTT